MISVGTCGFGGEPRIVSGEDIPLGPVGTRISVKTFEWEQVISGRIHVPWGRDFGISVGPVFGGLACSDGDPTVRGELRVTWAACSWFCSRWERA